MTTKGKPAGALAAAIAIGAMVTALAGYVWFSKSLFGLDLTVSGVQAFVLGFGTWGIVAVIGLMVVHCIIPFPSELIAFSAGLIYGWMEGSLIVWAAAMIGATASYWAARIAGRPLVRHLLSGRQFAWLESWTGNASLGVLLMVRLVPLVSFNLINYAAGVANIPWWKFLWTTAVGITPLTIYSVWLGERMQQPTVWDWVILGATLLAITTLAWTMKRWRKGAGSVLGRSTLDAKRED